MRTHRRVSRVGHLVLTSLLVSLFTGCQQGPPPKPQPTGANQMFVTSGSIDDGDDQTTGPAQQYTDPARTANDGRSVAVSAPQSFRSLRGNVTAQSGPQPVRISSGNSTNKVTSTFVVRNPVTCQFEISSSASATLNSGKGAYQVVARVLDNAGKFIPGTDFQTRYDFAENPNGQLDVLQDGRQFTQIGNGGLISPLDRGPATAFTLQPGNYTVQFELNIDAQADTSAAIRVSATTDLI